MARVPVIISLLFAAFFAQAEMPDWIWHSEKAKNDETCFFRKTFSCSFKPAKAQLICTADNELTVFLNGKQVGQTSDYKKPVEVDVQSEIQNGENTLAVRAKNFKGSAGVLLKLELRTENNFPNFVLSDTSWLTSSTEETGWEKPGFSASHWPHSVSLGKLGVEPWGDVFGKPSATLAESLIVLPGFKVQLVKSAQLGEGSWICMTMDDKGRFIISPEKGDFPLLRVTVSRQGQLVRTEKVSAGVHGAMGMVYAWDSLFVNSRGPKGMGLYRLTDKNHNDQFEADEVELVKGFDGDTEHGCHALAVGPDEKLYVMNGNHTKVPPGIAPNSAHQNYGEDLLLPRMWDANGHAKGIYAPGGYVVRSDRNLKKWEMICGGFRNTYDFDFNPDGEIFTFDSDMEWDIGAPWYRPTRINHIVSGGEYGWRSGTGKWPAYYPDSLPGNLDMGYGSPTAVKFGTRSKFPPKYRDALFLGDWALGKISAVHLRADGATYTGTSEPFISGKPLNVSGMEFGQDGAMYFIIGGWKTQSGLYRVSYVGTAPKAEPVSAQQKRADKLAAKERDLRHKLESFHGKQVPGAVDFAWQHLGNSDRWLRYAARIAVESQDATLWQKRALTEKNTAAAVNALLALSRRGDKALQPQIVARLVTLLAQSRTEEQQLELLRTLEVCFTRMGKPEAATAAVAIKALSSSYPAKTENLNREICQLLVFLDWAEAVPKTLALMAAAPTQQEQMHYAFVLRNATNGWTMDGRTNYFTWFHKALGEYKGGHSFEKYLLNIRDEAADKLPAAERKELASIIEFKPERKVVTLPPRAFVKEWKLSDFAADLDKVGKGRSFAKGKEAFAAAQCILCHRVAGDGGSVGPDLAGVSGRFNHHDLLDNILSPSKIISDRYQSFTIIKKDEEDVSGCIVEENDEKVVVLVDPLNARQVVVNKSDIKSRMVSKLSPMPEGLLSVLTKQEILDLLAFLESDGRSNGPAFAAAK